MGGGRTWRFDSINDKPDSKRIVEMKVIQQLSVSIMLLRFRLLSLFRITFAGIS